MEILPAFAGADCERLSSSLPLAVLPFVITIFIIVDAGGRLAIRPAGRPSVRSLARPASLLASGMVSRLLAGRRTGHGCRPLLAHREDELVLQRLVDVIRRANREIKPEIAFWRAKRKKGRLFVGLAAPLLSLASLRQPTACICPRVVALDGRLSVGPSKILRAARDLKRWPPELNSQPSYVRRSVGKLMCDLSAR